jgi:transposase
VDHGVHCALWGSARLTDQIEPAHTSDPSLDAAVIRGKASGATRVGLESGPLSTWHWHELRRLGLPGCAPCQSGPVGAAGQVRPQRRARPGVNRAHGLVSRGRGQGLGQPAGPRKRGSRQLDPRRAQAVRAGGRQGRRPAVRRTRPQAGPGQSTPGGRPRRSSRPGQAINDQITTLSRRLIAIARQD